MSDPMYRGEVLGMNLRKSEDLCKLVEDLGYGGFPNQLQCNNGAYVSSLLNFFDDNPGAMDAIKDWILNSTHVMDDPDEVEEDNEEEDSE